MPRLVVEKFSSLHRADVEIAPLTLLVGPQASGKSLISKLFYFFNEMPGFLNTLALDGETPKTAKSRLGARFKEWFPASAWGGQDFKIVFEAGPIQYSVGRSKSRGRDPSIDVDFNLSNWIAGKYSKLIHQYKIAKQSTDRSIEDEYVPRFSGPLYDIERAFIKDLRELSGVEFVNSQVFIPAGRSFFTNLGKAFAILEHGGRIDTLLSRFGSLYAFLVDEGAKFYIPNNREARNLAKLRQERRREIMVKLFGGHLRLGGNKQFLETEDGRQIPFALMSSGQQELLPLWLVLSYIARQQELHPGNKSISLTYIEEPEAHLFPSAQSFLIEYLASLINEANLQNNMIVSTHSPYVVSKLNNLLKAGALGENSNLSKEVKAIVPIGSWMLPSNVNAYAIRDGVTESIMDQDGLISGSYLDEISGDISSEFLELLGVEVKNEP